MEVASWPGEWAKFSIGSKKDAIKDNYQRRQTKGDSDMDSFNTSGCPAIRVVMMPRDANAHNTIFGGVLLSYIDQAGFIEAMRQAEHRYVTIAMNRVEFKKPVFIGDIVSFYADTTRIGTTSISIHVKVQCHRQGTLIILTEADLIFVATDKDNNPVPVLED